MYFVVQNPLKPLENPSKTPLKPLYNPGFWRGFRGVLEGFEGVLEGFWRGFKVNRLLIKNEHGQKNKKYAGFFNV